MTVSWPISEASGVRSLERRALRTARGSRGARSIPDLLATCGVPPTAHRNRLCCGAVVGDDVGTASAVGSYRGGEAESGSGSTTAQGGLALKVASPSPPSKPLARSASNDSARVRWRYGCMSGHLRHSRVCDGRSPQSARQRTSSQGCRPVVSCTAQTDGQAPRGAGVHSGERRSPAFKRR